MPASLRVSFYCGLSPIILGILIFIGWFSTNLEIFILAGLILILVGMAIFVIGMISLVVYFLKNRQSEAFSIAKMSTAFALLVANFPVAVGITALHFWVSSYEYIEISNKTETDVTDFVVSDNWKNHFEIATIKPGEMSKNCLHFSGEGPVSFSYFIKGQKIEHDFIDYYLRSMSLDRYSIEISSSADSYPVSMNRELAPFLAILKCSFGEISS